MSYVAKFEIASKWEAAAKTGESLEEKREGTITANKEKSEMLIEELIIIKGQQFS